MGRAAADICRIAAKELPQARIIEGRAQQPLERRQRCHCRDQPRLFQDRGRQGGQLRSSRLYHGRIERRKKPSRPAAEAGELRGIAIPGKGADGADIALFVMAQVQRAAIGPEVAGEHVLPHERQVVLDPGAERGKEVVEHMPHRQHRGSGINRTCLGLYGANLAAWRSMPLEHRHLVARRAQADGTGQPCYARADDQCAGRLRGRSDLHGPIVDSSTQCVQYDLHIDV